MAVAAAAATGAAALWKWLAARQIPRMIAMMAGQGMLGHRASIKGIQGQKDIATMQLEAQKKAQEAQLKGLSTLEDKRNKYHKETLAEKRKEADRIATQGREMAQFQFQAQKALGMQQAHAQLASMLAAPQPSLARPTQPAPDLAAFIALAK